MKRLFSLLLAVLLLSIPALGAAEGTAGSLASLEDVYDLSFLTDVGILTEEEVRLLTYEKESLAAGRELTGTMRLTAAGVDTAVAELVERLTVLLSMQRSEGAVSLLLDGQELLSLGHGVKDGMHYLAPSPLQDLVALTEKDLKTLPLRLVNAAQAAGLIDGDQAMEYGYQISYLPTFTDAGSMPTAWRLMQIDYSSLDLTAWNETYEPVKARVTGGPVTEQPGDCNEAASAWTVSLTGEDMQAFLIAALKVVRDNAALSGEMQTLFAIPEATGSAQVIDMILASAEGMEMFPGEAMTITGWNDAAGELVRLQVDLIDDEMEETLYASIIYTCCEGDDGTTWQVRTAGGNSNGCFRLTVGEGLLLASYTVLGEEDAVLEEIALSIQYDVTRTEGRTDVTASAVLTTEFCGMIMANGERVAATVQKPLAVNLDATIMPAGCRVNVNVEAENVNIYDEDLSLTLSSELSIDGLDVTGIDRATAVIGGRTATAVIELQSQEPASSIFDSEAVNPGAMTDEELSAWVGEAAQQVQDWASDVLPKLPASMQEALGGSAE